MTRPQRIEYPGAWYHVMNRGAQRRATFRSPADNLMFFDVLAEAVSKFGIEIHAYALMGNHFHLLVRTPDPSLGKAMRHIDGVYTQRFNHRHDIDGPLFRGRYKAILIGDDSYQLSASRYIHRNPVAAGLVASARASVWTSYPSYLGLAPTPSWLRTGETLKIIGGRKRYEAFVEQLADPLADPFYAQDRLASIFGTEAFQQQIEDQFQTQEPDGDLEPIRPHDSIVFQQVARALAQALPTAASATNQPTNAEVRLTAATLAREQGISTTAIANQYGYSNGDVARASISRFRRSLKNKPILNATLSAARQLLNPPSIDVNAA